MSLVKEKKEVIGEGQQNQPTTSGQCTLEEASINLKQLREQSVNDLIAIINEVDPEPRNKILVLDPTLAGPLGLVAEISILKKHGIERIYYLAPGQLPTDAKHIIYLIRPKIKYMRYIAQHIRNHNPADEKTYNIFFVPRKRLMCEVALQEEGVFAVKSIRIGEFPLYLIPFDSDLLSMELNTFKEVSVDGDKTSLFNVAKSIMQLQMHYGIIPNIMGKGSNCQFVKDMILRMRRENLSEEQLVVPEIDTIILLDREVDLMTPLCTQLTYEGLIDEIFGIIDGTVDLPAEMVIDPKSQEGKDPIPVGKKFKTALNSNDKLFRDVRDLNFSMVGPQLNAKAKHIDEYYKERYAAKTITEIKDFMNKLPSFQREHQYLRIQSNIAEAVLSFTRDPVFRARLECEQNLLALSDPEEAMNYIEECINKQEPFSKVFRLLCLYSQTNNGIREKAYNGLRKDLLQTYGYECLYFMEHLMKLGMFKLSTSRVNPYSRIKQDLNLIIEEMNEKDPGDVAYVYSGYAPVSIRLVQQALVAPSPSVVLSELKIDETSNGSGRSFQLLQSAINHPNNPIQLDQKYAAWSKGWGDLELML